MAAEYDLKSTVRTIPDYPKPGIMFRDITTLLGDARAFRRAVDEIRGWEEMIDAIHVASSGTNLTPHGEEPGVTRRAKTSVSNHEATTSQRLGLILRDAPEKRRSSG